MLFLILCVLIAGLITGLSVMSSIIAVGRDRRKFVAGLMFSFPFFTWMVAILLQLFEFSPNILRYSAVLLIGYVGFAMVLPYLSDWFFKVTHKAVNKCTGFTLGIALGFIWALSIGIVLAAFTALISAHDLLLKIALVSLAFSVGAGMAILFCDQKNEWAPISWLSHHAERIRQVFGWILIFTAVALAFNLDTVYEQKVTNLLPRIQVEDNAYVNHELEKLRPPPLSFPSATESSEITPTISEIELGTAHFNQPSEYTLKGSWVEKSEFILSASSDSIIELVFEANRVDMVLGGQSNLPIRVELDGKQLSGSYQTIDTDNSGNIFVLGKRKYAVVNMRGEGGRHRLTLHFPKGIEVYAIVLEK